MDDRIKRGQHAERLLTDELFVETFEALRKHALHAWETSGPQDTELREEAWRTIRVLDSVKMAFETYAKQGVVDKQMLEHAKTAVDPVA
jgi:hypothetical protein